MKRSLLFTLSLLTFILPGPAQAYRILFYYNSQDGTEGGLRRCASFLKQAGNQVTLVDVAGKQYDPTADNWGAPYDQVWDARFVNRDKEACGSGSPQAADYFDGKWRSKAVSFLQQGGNLYIEAEYYQLTDRDEGLYAFLKQAGAVKPGYDDCPPSSRGNSATDVAAFYPVHPGLGPVSFYGKYVGGIPLSFLTGRSFVDTPEDWEGDDRVDRSIVSGWTGHQLGLAVPSPSCDKGKLFMVWDATMWTLWQEELRPERSSPIWDDDAWPPNGADDQDVGKEIADYLKGREVTRRFFPAIARWLGPRVEPCEGAVSPPPAPPSPAPAVRGTPTPQALPAPAASYLSSNPTAGPQTIIFSQLPVNIYVHFADGPGTYRVAVYDGQGREVAVLFEKLVLSQKETWTTWDGWDEYGKMRTAGTYYAILGKDGRFLRKIVLDWVVAPAK